MIRNWLITGDCHGDFLRFHKIPNKEDVGLIILGDAGWNFYLNRNDWKKKNDFHNNYKFTVYCVRGNHEARPSSLDNLIEEYDGEVGGFVAYQDGFPRIKYLEDWAIYELNNSWTFGVIGGAYSVDKWYRLARAGITDSADNNPKRTGWWANEMLTEKEQHYAKILFNNQKVDFMFSHTCPYKWEPRDLFLNFIDQTNVNKEMEYLLDDIESHLDYKIWCFGHFHADREELFDPERKILVQQLYQGIMSLEDLMLKYDQKMGEANI